MAIDYSEKIPNNVGLAEDRRLQRALESWQPKFTEWWADLGPAEYESNDVYLRTAIDVGQDGWAHYDFVKMPDYRWGSSSPSRKSIARSVLVSSRRPGLARGARRVPQLAKTVAGRTRRYGAGLGRTATPPRPHSTEPL